MSGGLGSAGGGAGQPRTEGFDTIYLEDEDIDADNKNEVMVMILTRKCLSDGPGIRLALSGS